MPGEIVFELVVREVPQTKGSHIAVPIYENPKAPPHARKIRRRPGGSFMINVIEDNAKAKPFMKAVHAAAEAAAMRQGVLPNETDPFELECLFFLGRKEGDWGTGRNAHLLKDHAQARPVGRGKGDTDKLVRAVQDALEGIVWTNDSQVVKVTAEKRFAVPTVNDDGIVLSNERAVLMVRRHPFVVATDLPESERVRGVAPADTDQLALV